MGQERSGIIKSVDVARVAANKLSMHGDSRDVKEAAGAIFALCNVVTELLERVEKLEAEK